MGWQVRPQLTDKIGQVIEKENWTIFDVAKQVGTSKPRVPEVVKGNTEGISFNVLLRVLGALSSSIKISFKKVS